MGNVNEKNSLNNNYSIEATIITFIFNNNTKHFEVYYNLSLDPMILKRTHINFINLYNKLKIGATYNFKCSSWIFTYNEIIDIIECAINTTTDIIVGFLEVQNENSTLNNYEEIIIQNNINKRILINKNLKQDIIIGDKYVIKYVKKFGYDFYNVLSIEINNL